MQYTAKIPKVIIDANDNVEEVYPSLSFSNLIIALLNTPVESWNVAKIVIISIHELYKTTSPYSSVDNSLVKKGVVKKDIPFWIILQ